MPSKTTPLTHIRLKTNKRTAIFPRFPADEVLPQKFGPGIITHSLTKQELLQCDEEQAGINGFLYAINRAFSQHLPLRLKPEYFWMLILQGVAKHIDQNPEKYRHLLVEHEGKAEIKVRDDALLVDKSRWATIPDQLIQEFRGHLADAGQDLETFLPSFSTTTDAERIAFQIGILDIYSNYFDYLVMSLCGIPEIELEGSPDDWQEIEDRLNGLAFLELDWWTRHLRPIIRKIKASAAGEADVDFWTSIYKYMEMSGGPYISGWIINFFPYLKEKGKLRDKPKNDTSPGDAFQSWSPSGIVFSDVEKRNPYLGMEEVPRVLKMDNFHTGVSRVPFKWMKTGTLVDMHFTGGFIGVDQDEDSLALVPKLGWIVSKAAAGQ
ncbi:DUF4419 domain-containing protein [Flavilitoribacter nigricans]|uniref:DUF4419 domain-containing protein n=1 Tax=Flavilitoribacter nigricans (strain ATCC 23147 / DSM 23189 / NBRC 102662 / NCIMB 1420 / SS-2) TaxID=1122177 RepID=A0A2D0MZI8_FLAN2|nr:DUF4419 domain-containing protein [Flavilitoribacter nigricans]PHN01548.1 hypothetical protein CRP01_36730 [Flavilitoribacter nigricans DSM 23189 = NBRC 102662]